MGPESHRTGVLTRREEAPKQKDKGECQAMTEAETGEMSTGKGVSRIGDNPRTWKRTGKTLPLVLQGERGPANP